MPKLLVEKEERLKKGKIVHEILRLLVRGDVEVADYSTMGIFASFAPKLEEVGIGRRRKNNVRVALDRLRRQRCVEYTNRRDKNVLRLTDLGMRRLEQYKLEELKGPSEAGWDGKWRIVLFEIPEARKVARDAINRKLKQLGCFQLQRSTFIHFRPIYEEVVFIADYFGLREQITYIDKAVMIGIEDRLKKHFRLQ